MEKSKVKIFKDLSKFLRLTTFLESYTMLNPKGGIYHRINGKSTGASSKKTSLTIDDKRLLSDGLKSLQADINTVVKQFDKDVKNGEIQQ